MAVTTTESMRRSASASQVAPLEYPPPRSHLQFMDAPLDEASTSDADERETLEAARSDMYWNRVLSTRHLNLRPPDALSDQGDDM
jgi:hypothetical protein